MADVAWAATHYAAWTGDGDFLAGAGRDLVVDTARFWASRIRTDAGGRGHLDGVEGPDEYHEVVDDNAYTNVMARWNLSPGRQAPPSGRPELGRKHATGWHWRGTGGRVERRAWASTSSSPATSTWSPSSCPRSPRRPVAVDVLLGAERVAGSQLIKQADVLMLHHLVPDEVAAGSLGPCLAFYEPRTAHGSSLSPAISASPAGPFGTARAGARAVPDGRSSRPRRPHRHNRRGTAPGHHGWGLASPGLRLPRPATRSARAQGRCTLAIDPSLPESWTALGLTFRLHGQRIGVRADHDQVDSRLRGAALACVSAITHPPMRATRRHVSRGARRQKEATMSIVVAALDTTSCAPVQCSRRRSSSAG